MAGDTSKTQINWRINTEDLDSFKEEARERGFDSPAAYQNYLMRERRQGRDARKDARKAIEGQG